MIDILGSYQLTLICDGVTNTVIIPLRLISTPPQFTLGQLPKGIIAVNTTGTTPAAIPFTYDSGTTYVTLTFSIAPTGNVPIQIDANFGKAGTPSV